MTSRTDDSSLKYVSVTPPILCGNAVCYISVSRIALYRYLVSEDIHSDLNCQCLLLHSERGIHIEEFAVFLN